MIMDKMQGMIPLNTSPDIKIMQSIDKWSKSENTWKREGQTRLVSLVAGAPIALVGAAFNAIVLLIKLPVATFRVLTGWIPTKEGHFRDDMPADTSVVHMIWHAYKVVMCTIDIVLIPVMGVIHPKANNWIHVKLCVGFVAEEKPKLIPSHKIPKPPPPPPKTIDKKKIEKRRDERGTCLVNGKEVRFCDFEADELRKRRLALRECSDDSSSDDEDGLPLGPDDEDGLLLGPDDEPDLTERVWGVDVDKGELIKQKNRLKPAKNRKLGPKIITQREREFQAAIERFTLNAVDREDSNDDLTPNGDVHSDEDDGGWGSSDDDW